MKHINFTVFRVLIFISIILLHNPVFSQLFGPQQQITGGDIGVVRAVYNDDLNNDNMQDVIGVSHNKVVWYKNLGEGNFDFQVTIKDSLNGGSSVSADFDGDGDIDIAYTSYNSIQLGWVENDGNGEFIVQHSILSNISPANSIFTADLDNDQDFDLLLTSSVTDQVFWFKNDGSGNFTFQDIVFEGDDGFLTIDISDMDNDGDNDITILNSVYLTSESQFFWMENDGTGSFTGNNLITDSGVSSYYFVDLDGDNDMDLAIYLGSEYEIAWIENEGNGVFGSVSIIDDSLYSAGNLSLSAFDFDNDGDNDILAGANNNYGIFWYENEGNGIYSDMQVINMSEGIIALNIHDFDNDGLTDFSCALHFDSKVVWFKNQGNSTFSNPFLLTTKTKYARDVHASDIDGDGDNDIISASQGDGKIAVYENISYQEFGTQLVIAEEEGHSGTMSIIACDLDNDTDQDILCGFLHNEHNDRSLIWFQNDGYGNMDTSLVIVEEAEIDDLCVADLDSDGDQDIIVASYEGIQWYENLGDGDFGTKQMIEWVYDYNNSVFASDLDEDYDLDILFSRRYGDNIAYYKNDNAGNFSDRTLIFSDEDPVDVWATDINNDGHIDIIAAVADRVIWCENLQYGNFGEEQVIASNLYYPKALFAADVDNDDDNDIVFGYSSYVVWHENLGDGTFGEQQIITDIASGLVSVFITDIDNDSDLDILSASMYDGKIAWYENLLITTGENVVSSISNLVKVYPNPADDWVYIQSPFLKDQSYTCEIIDMYGRLIKRIDIPTGQTSVEIDISKLQTGMYFIRLEGSQFISSKLIIR